MKIALNILHFRAAQGGAEGDAATLANGLVRRGHEVHIFSQDFEAPGLPVVHHPVHPAPWPRCWKEFSFALRSRSAVHQAPFDLVLSFGKTFGADVVKLSGGLHQVWFEHDLASFERTSSRMLKRVTRAFSPRHLLAKLLEERQLKEPCCRRVVVMSEILKRDVVRVCKYPESRIAVIRNGIDVERFHPRQREARREAVRHKHGIGQEVIILFMSHNFRLKGLGPLVRAVAGLSRGEQSVVKCLIVGRGRARPFELLASELGVRERFLFAGPTDRPEDYYAAADVLAHPTFYDSFGNVCLEAMATSLPVVTTAFCGASEIITSGQEGMIVQDPWNAEELANALRRYLDADERSRAGLAARRLAEKYDAERNCEEMLALFGAVIRERNSKGG